MEFLKRNLTQIQSQMSGMSFATRWLIASLVVIMLLVGGMLVWWGGSADMVPVDGFTTGSTAEAVAILEADNIKASVTGGKLMVPRNQMHEAVASLSRAGQLNPNAHAAFDKLMATDGRGWMESSTEKDRRYLAAKGQFLSAVISSFPNVDYASVMVDKPQNNGLGGPSHIDPSASVMVTMQAGGKVNRQMADTLIHMVSSAVAGLDELNVKVTDTINSRSFTAANPEEVSAMANVEATLTSERLHKQKIEDVLRSWRGATVAVKIVTSHVLREDVKQTDYDDPAISLSETESRESKNIAAGAEPGVRPNVGDSIDIARGGGNETTEERRTEQFNTPLAKLTSVKQIAGNAIRQINVSVTVPRSYYVSVYKAQQPEAEGEPSNADLAPIVTEEEQKIADLVEPLIVSSDETIAPGSIKVAMVNDQAYLEPAVAGVGSGIGAVMSSDTTQTGLLAGLAFMSMCLMIYMVRRATRKEDLPTVEELAGVPTTLPTDDDLIGEVDEIDTGLDGVELDEEELRARQIADQISDLVRANPEEAGGLLTKWIVDDQN